MFQIQYALDKKYTFKKYTLYKKYTRSVLPGLVTKYPVVDPVEWLMVRTENHKKHTLHKKHTKSVNCECISYRE